MSLGDHFPEHIKKEFAERGIDIGKTVLIEIEDFDINYPKYVIIVADNSNDIACVVINTEINENCFPSSDIQSLHIKIDQVNHSFLKYDSFINCTEIREFQKHNIIEFLKNNPERAVGNVSEEILKKIHNTITIAKTITAKDKKRFGFI